MADAEAGFGGQLNAFELMKSMIEAGAAGLADARLPARPAPARAARPA